MPTYRGTAGNDRLTGFNSDDLFIGSAGSDTIDGGNGGLDTADYSAISAITANFTGSGTTATVTKSGATAQTDSLSSIERVIGSSYNDVFMGRTTGQDLLYFVSGPGQDTIHGYGRPLNVADYSDAKEIVVDAFRGTVFDGKGSDVLIDVAGFQGSPGNDIFVGAAGTQFFRGGAGNDTFYGVAGEDIINGQAGIDLAWFEAPLSALSITRLPLAGPSTYTVSSATDGFDSLLEVERITAGGITYGAQDATTGLNTLLYFANNPDVVRAGLDAATHYDAHGWREGRDPNPYFSTSGYLAANPDVAAAGINPLDHYLRQGWREGRDPSISFDGEAYLGRNPDARAAGIAPLLHFLSADGQGRAPSSAIGPNAGATGFDRQWYLMNNRDVAAGDIDAEAQYRLYGAREGRNPNAWFDTNGYRAAYADVAADGVDPLLHYTLHGWREGRDPSAAFDTKDYLTANPDVAATGVNPLLHFLAYGAAEGRVAIGDGLFG